LKKIYYFLLLHLVLGIFTILYFDGTGDAGDSVYHYLFAKYAPINNELYFDHWAKPLYVLIASPFAQLGFVGVKLMNLILVNLTLLVTYLLAKKLQIKNAILTPLILIFSPLYFALTFTGLTEPLFAFLLTLSLYLFVQKKLYWSCLIISFLPFVRSEGLFFIGIFGGYLIFFKQWKPLLLLGFGSLVYSLAGFPFYNDLLWVFNKVPYAKLSSTYGNGDAFHFVIQLQFVIGIPIYILFWLGILSWFKDLFSKKITLNTTYFIYGSVFVFLLAHSIFWYFGIFNSMGLKRVIICVLPFISIIAVKGFNLLFEFKVKLLYRRLFGGALLAYIIIFPFTSNPAAIDFKHELSLNTDQQLAKKVTHKIEKLNFQKFRLLTNHPYLCETLNINCFDENERKFLNQNSLQNLRKNDVLVWESWFSIVEHGLEKNVLDSNNRLQKVYSISEENHKGRTIEYAIYLVK
jgi:hypothetical protein